VTGVSIAALFTGGLLPGVVLAITLSALVPIWGYLLALLVGLIVVAIFPWISIGFL